MRGELKVASYHYYQLALQCHQVNPRAPNISEILKLFQSIVSTLAKAFHPVEMHKVFGYEHLAMVFLQITIRWYDFIVLSCPLN